MLTQEQVLADLESLRAGLRSRREIEVRVLNRYGSPETCDRLAAVARAQQDLAILKLEQSKLERTPVTVILPLGSPTKKGRGSAPMSFHARRQRILDYLRAGGDLSRVP